MVSLRPLSARTKSLIWRWVTRLRGRLAPSEWQKRSSMGRVTVESVAGAFFASQALPRSQSTR